MDQKEASPQRPVELIREDWDYILYDYGKNNLYLSVTCGRSAVFTVSFFLTPKEKRKFLETGNKEDVSLLASNVRFSPSRYSERSKKSEERRMKLTGK